MGKKTTSTQDKYTPISGESRSRQHQVTLQYRVMAEILQYLRKAPETIGNKRFAEITIDAKRSKRFNARYYRMAFVKLDSLQYHLINENNIRDNKANKSFFMQNRGIVTKAIQMIKSYVQHDIGVHEFYTPLASITLQKAYPKLENTKNELEQYLTYEILRIILKEIGIAALEMKHPVSPEDKKVFDEAVKMLQHEEYSDIVGEVAGLRNVLDKWHHGFIETDCSEDEKDAAYDVTTPLTPRYRINDAFSVGNITECCHCIIL